MAELLVRVRDKININSIYLDAKCTKRGDVIVVQPDGWSWGKEELANPDWRVISLPGVDPEDLSGLLAPELDTDSKNPSRVLQRRAFKLDLDHPDVGAAGLRDFIDTHATVDVLKDAPANKVETVNVVSKLEDIKLIDVPDGKGGTMKQVVSTFAEIVTPDTKIALDGITDQAVANQLALLPGVTMVGKALRAKVVARADPNLITTITKQKPALKDPAIIGGNSNVIGG